MAAKRVCLLFLRRPGEILLAMKKRGFGAGKWNGTGGKLEAGETPVAAAIRETHEEIGVRPLNARLVGRLRFYLVDDPSFEHDCFVFVANKWEGEPTETDEMRPQWFAEADIPYGQMWADDRLWLPLLLAGQQFEGTATIDGDQVARHTIQPTKSIEE